MVKRIGCFCISILLFKNFYRFYFCLLWFLLLRFSSCSKQGKPFVVVHGLLIVVTSVVEHEL